MAHVGGSEGEFAVFGGGAGLRVAEVDAEIATEAAATGLQEALGPAGKWEAHFEFDLRLNVACDLAVGGRFAVGHGSGCCDVNRGIGDF